MPNDPRTSEATEQLVEAARVYRKYMHDWLRSVEACNKASVGTKDRKGRDLSFKRVVSVSPEGRAIIDAYEAIEKERRNDGE